MAKKPTKESDFDDAKAEADKQSKRREQGKTAVQKPKAPKKVSAKSKAKKPSAAAEKKKAEQAEAKRHNEEVSLFDQLSKIFEDLKDDQMAIKELVGQMGTKIKGLLDENDWHKGALSDMRKIDRMSETKRRDYLATMMPMLYAMWNQKWKAESEDLLSELEATPSEPEIEPDDFDKEREGDQKVVPISNAKKGADPVADIASEPELSDDDDQPAAK